MILPIEEHEAVRRVRTEVGRDIVKAGYGIIEPGDFGDR
jgi:hypothetical protein